VTTLLLPISRRCADSEKLTSSPFFRFTEGKDYGEFRNFVSVSQLKPVPRSDISSLFNGITASIARESSVAGGKVRGEQADIGGFEDIVQMRKDMSNPPKSIANVDKHLKSLSLGYGRAKLVNATKSSRSVDDFLKEWKRYCPTVAATLSFLTRIDSSRPFENQLILRPDVVCKDYFSADIDSDVLGDIIEALHLLVDMSKAVETPSAIANMPGPASKDDYENDSCREATGTVELLSSEANVSLFIHDWLKALSSCGRFGLNISFLTLDQQLKLKEVCSFLEKSNDDKAAVDELLLKYCAVLQLYCMRSL
jgi:hypothetical protein